MIDTSHEQGMSDQAFQKIAQIAISNAGLSIPSSKKALVQSRISRRLRALGLNTINEYLEIITDTSQNAERKELISILTTNVSSFYREEHHFSHLVSQVFPTVRKKISQNKTVRFWSSGCSSGQEPYTISMEVLKYFNLNEQKNILILATDIDPVILKKAQMAIYSDTEIEPVRRNGCQKFFVESEHGNQISVR
ncbi:MAG: hypothetical protein KJO69_02330 [Gammaproteobacteria bacterium]|nr:hypothetical protein [Gammaproteobacteria bacterium]